MENNINDATIHIDRIDENNVKNFFTFKIIKQEIISHFSLYTILLIIYGYWNFHSYYMFFGINIYHYVNTTEILLSFIPASFKYLYAIIATIFNLLIPIVFVHVNKAYRAEDFKNSNTIFIFLISLAAGSIYLIKSWGSIDYTMYKTISYLLLYFIISIYLFITVYVLKKNFTLKSIFKFVIYYSLIQLAFLILVENFFESKLTLHNQSLYAFEFELDSITYGSNNTLVFIGETQDYIFLRNLKTDYNMVFNKSDIKQFKLKKDIVGLNWQDKLFSNGKNLRLQTLKSWY